MSPYKLKFTAHPQHDAEGFTVMDAQCRGCTPDEMCPRSGHCERYESPLRLVTDLGEVDVPNTAIKNLDWTNPALMQSYRTMGKLAVKLSEMTDQELNEVHSHWLRNGRSE